MTETIDAATDALGRPALLDLPRAAPLPPPTFDQPTPMPVSTSMPAPVSTSMPAPMSTPMPPPPPPVAAVPVAAVPVAAVPVAAVPAADPAPMTTGPSAIFSADAAIMPPEHAAPVLPTHTPAIPSATSAPVAAAAFDFEDFLGTQTKAKKTPAKPRGRWLVRLVVVGLLGAGGWAANQHGPALYDQYVRGNEAGTPAETTAPLAFPNITAVAAPIRTAEFMLVGLPETPGTTYRITTDFETDVSQVDIVRDSGPDLQILTYGADAMIRRADGDDWYLLDRGLFPLDGRLERSDWVRMIDELLPTELRSRAVIDQSTESMISGVPTRHLTLTLDATLLDAMGGVASEPTDPAVGTPIDLVPATDEQLDAATAVSPAADPALSPTPSGPLEIEVWIDGQGLVRQITGAPQLGAETITIVRTTADAWIPDYPAPGDIAPLTASALVDLGL